MSRALRPAYLFLGALVLATAAIIPITAHLIEQDRATLLEEFSAGRLAQLQELADDVEEDLRDVADGIDFAARHLASAGSDDEERRRVLETLLSSVKAYRAAAVYGPSLTPHLIVTTPRISEEISKESKASMARSAHRAIQPAGPDVAISGPVQPEPQDWYRVFAAQLPTLAKNQPREAISLLVDTRPFFKRFKTAVSDPQTKLVILGPHGHVAPISSDDLAHLPKGVSSMKDATAQLVRVFDKVKSGESGALKLDTLEVESLDFAAADAVAAFVPIRIDGGGHWSAITFTSLSTLRSHERAIARRLGLSAAAVAFVLFGFAGYVLFSTKRAAVLRERIRHATELAHLREWAEKTLDSIPTCVMSISKGGRVVGMNQALQEKLPATSNNTLLQDAFPLAPREQVSQLTELVADAANRGTVQSLLAEELDLFGETGHYSLHAIPIEHRFGDVDAVLVIDDLTELRLLEDRLLRTEKLATVGTLAAGIAHEIGTPLGVVRGRAEYIAGKIGKNHPQSTGLTTIAEQVDRIARTIQLLLDFSRVKPATTCPVEVSPILDKVIELLEYEAERRKVVVVVDAADNVPLLAADSDQFQQVLINLLLNALDACDPGGSVCLHARPGDIETGVNFEHVRIEISDNGKGIAPENLFRVFDPFFTTKKRGQGTGLGLTVVSQIVRGHKAQIELNPIAEGGTKATLFWPTTAQKAEVHRAG